MERYNNELPEQLVFAEQPRYNDMQMLRKLKRAKEKDEVLTGECIKATHNGDLIIKLSPNLEGIIPRNEITYIIEKDGKVHKAQAQKKVFLDVNFKVTEIIEGDELKDTKVYLSRKRVVEDIRDKYREELKKGHLVQGVVIGIADIGAFIDIGGDVIGILPKAFICKVWIDHPSEKLRVGDSVDVVLKDEIGEKNSEELLITFTRKPLFKKWNEIDKEFKLGDVVKGRIKDTRGANGSGIFVEISDDFEGLANYTNKRYSYGDLVRVRIDNIDKKREKMKLTIID
ncbi:S1 RNA-binding domain-containing protein [Senegalia massiliensis]|uniref:S1 RNA-binding domain-containing protein n=1 Tax=Senegalia massiliensis TaxID=1720316 RepID=A0A845QYT3_9CLOT|nr:S1 RNA-binding domain-containing protein [Senegalia massiliensis]NBI07645.1 S1 RNA-binding domain-containing protein [Senegalia massiliensis]